MCVNKQPDCICSILHPALIPQGLGPSLICWRLIRGQLVRDTRAIVLTLTAGHWNANREHTKPNGGEEQQIFGQGPFFTDGAGLFMVDETRLEQNGHLAYWAFIWTVLKSNKANTTTCVETGRDVPELTLQSPLIKDWTRGRSDWELGWKDPS